MDITNIPNNLIKALEQKSTEQLVALSRVLNLALRKTVVATISSVEQVTPAEREQLLKQTSAALAQLTQQNSSKMTPAMQNEVARLVQQQQLIQSPELKWVNLVVNNRALLVYSDKPLNAGQSIPVQIQNGQKLVLLDLSASTTSKNSDEVNTTKTTTNTPVVQQATQVKLNATLAPTDALNKTFLNSKSVANAALEPPAELTNTSKQNLQKIGANLENQLAKATTTDATKNTQQKLNAYTLNELTSKPVSSAHVNNLINDNSISKSAVTKQVISEQLRALLPLKDTPNTLFSAIASLSNLTQPQKAQLFTPSLELALKSIAEKIRTPDQLSNPKQLAQIIKTSGNFFESALNKATQSTTTGQSTHQDINKIIAQDLKGSLLSLLKQSTQELSNSSKPLTHEQAVRLFQNIGSLFSPSASHSLLAANSKQDITIALGMFVQELMQKPVKEMSNKELRAQLLVLLQQHSLHSLARVQLQQLHSLNHELEAKDSNTQNGSIQLEIPVKHHNDVHPMHLRIDREWVDDSDSSSSKKATEKVRQWTVTLRFDLPTLGEFCAQLSIVNTQVSATLWAEREKTFAEVQEKVDSLRQQLESEGINVKYLQCMRGMPPQKPMSISYSLIDVST